MTALTVMLELIKAMFGYLENEEKARLKEALTKLGFEIEKRIEVENFNHDEGEKLRMENKSLRDRNTCLVLENNKLKQMLQQLPED